MCIRDRLTLGITYSVNILISIDKEKTDYVNKVIGNGFTMMLGLCFLVFLYFFCVKLDLINLGERYSFDKFVIPTLIIAILTHINGFLSAIFRVFGKIYTIAITQSLYPFIIIFLIQFFRQENLLWAMLYANCAAVIISFLLFFIYSPVKIKPIMNWQIIKLIQVKGWYLSLIHI